MIHTGTLTLIDPEGATGLGTYFKTVRDRLAPDGVALIHSIMRGSASGETAHSREIARITTVSRHCLAT